MSFTRADPLAPRSCPTSARGRYCKGARGHRSGLNDGCRLLRLGNGRHRHWRCAGITHNDAPARLRKGAGRYPQPIALLARLGVDIAHESRGLGAGLLKDVVGRVAELGANIGCRGLLVHAESDQARHFYLHLVPGFAPSPTDPLHLVLLMKDIHRTLCP